MSVGDARRSGFPIAVWGLIVAWVAVAVLAVNWGIPNEERDLTSRANDLLEGTGLIAHFDGRDATITGVADESTIVAARNTIAKTRGVCRVDVSATESEPVTTSPAPSTTTTSAALPTQEASFAADQSDGSVELRGMLPDQELIDSIETAAATVYGVDAVTNRMDTGSVNDSPYLRFLPELFEISRGLDPWQVELEDGHVTYSGIGPNRDVVAEKRSALAIYRDSAQFAGVDISLEVDPRVVADTITRMLAGGANFPTGSAVLSDDARARLDRVIEIMTENPSTVLDVEGHTDNQGDAAANQTLSEARAQAVVDYLVAGGIEADRLTAFGYGEDRPIADNSTPEGRAQNRRIAFVVSEGE
jgi:outer membrane protein OmpA-like peptidoglycan-associated protein